MSDYNGWPNRATWNANLWLFNSDEDTYRRAKIILGFPIGLTDKAGDLQRLAKRLWGDKTPDGDRLDSVDWIEIVLTHRDD